MHGHQAADDPFLGEGDCEQTSAGFQHQGFRNRARTVPASWFRANGGDAEGLLSDAPASVQGAEQRQNASPRRTPGSGKGVRASASWLPQITEQEKPPPTGAGQGAAAETVEITPAAQHGGGEEFRPGTKKAPGFIEAMRVKKVPLWSAATLVLICVSISIIAVVPRTIYVSQESQNNESASYLLVCSEMRTTGSVHLQAQPSYKSFTSSLMQQQICLHVLKMAGSGVQGNVTTSPRTQQTGNQVRSFVLPKVLLSPS